MKRTLCFLLASIMALALVGCESTSGGPATSITSGEVQTNSENSPAVVSTSTEFSTKIFEDKYFSVELRSISLHEALFDVKNKSDVAFTIMLSDLILDGVDYGSSESCWEIGAGETGEMVYYNGDKELNIDAVTLSGSIMFIDDGGIYGDNQEDIPIGEIALK